MKRILLIATVYRVGERIYSTIPELSKLFNLDLLVINEMSNEMIWYGDNDPRITFHKSYQKYFDNIYDAGFNSSNTNPSKVLLGCDVTQYDLILCDDDRKRYGIVSLYEEAKRYEIPVVGCIHGAGVGFGSGRIGSMCNHLFVFGDKDCKENNYNKNVHKIGVPSNDILKEYKKTDNHILVIVNYLANRSCPYKVQVDEEYIKKIGLVELQNEFDKKVVFKLKSRHDHPHPQKDIDYLNSIVGGELEYEIIVDNEDNNKLISDSFIIISAPSTLSFKSIQLGIPTILIIGSGDERHFSDFKGLVELDTQVIFDEIERQYRAGKDKDFILNTIEGGDDFTSTNKFINIIKEII